MKKLDKEFKRIQSTLESRKQKLESTYATLIEDERKRVIESKESYKVICNSLEENEKYLDEMISGIKAKQSKIEDSDMTKIEEVKS